MNAPNVRSATVRLNAEVAKYIADIKAAGRATDQAFSSAHQSVGRFDEDLKSTTKSSDALAEQTRKTSEETTGLGDSLGKTTQKTKEYNLQTAIAAERTTRFRKSLREQARAALDAETAITDVDRSTTVLATNLNRSGNAIDRTSGRLALLAKAGATVGPGLIPVGAVGIAGIAGLASQLGFAAAGVTSLVVASQGLGDALKAVEKARLDPTVENLEDARDAMEQLGPHAQLFVRRFQDLRPTLADIRDQAAAGWFPGLIEAMDHFEEIGPRVGRIFKAIGETGGDLVAEAAEALAGPEWAEFLTFIKQEAPGALEDLGHTAGNLISGMAQLWMAFSPVNSDFSDWLLDASASFKDWATNLSKTDGFKEFVDYLRTNGPKVANAASAIGDALIQIVEAAAPLGGPVLDAIADLANIIAKIADSPLGTPIMVAVTALSAMSLASKVATASVLRLNAAMATLGVTSKKAGASTATATAAGAASKSGPAALAALVGLEVLPDMWENAKYVFEGDRSLPEGIGRMVAAATPTGVVLQTLGVDILGVKDKFLEATVGGRKLEETLLANGVAAEDAAVASGRLTRAQAKLEAAQARAELRTARQAEALKKAMKEQRAAVNETASAWSDYSQKVQLGDTGVEQLMNRWEKLGEASADMADNIQQAIGRGIDVDVIKDVIDTLGPQGAALALEQFANATGDRAAEIEADFLKMSQGIGDFKSAWDLTLSLVNGTPLTLGRDIIFELDMAKAAFDSLPKDVRTEIHAEGIPQTEAQVDALVEKYKLTERDRKALITLLDHASPTIKGILGLLDKVKDKHVTVTTTFVRELITKRSTVPQSPANPTLEGLLGVPKPGADGMTVPGQRQPYGDKVLAYLAPGEEVISNRHGQADRFRADRAAGRIPGYDAGGTVGSAPLVLTRGSDDAADKEVRRETEHRKRLNAQLKESEKAVERERKQRDAVVDRMKEISSSIRDSLLTDLGGESDNAWTSEFGSGTLAGNLATIRGDTVEARRMRRLVKILEGKGFDGPALADLLSRGDINEVASYASSSRGQLRRFEQAFAERAQLVRAVSSQGAEAALGKRLDTANDELQEANRELRQIKQRLQQANKDRKDEHEKDRTAQKRGAGDAARNRRRNP